MRRDRWMGAQVRPAHINGTFWVILGGFTHPCFTSRVLCWEERLMLGSRQRDLRRSGREGVGTTLSSVLRRCQRAQIPFCKGSLVPAMISVLFLPNFTLFLPQNVDTHTTKPKPSQDATFSPAHVPTCTLLPSPGCHQSRGCTGGADTQIPCSPRCKKAPNTPAPRRIIISMLLYINTEE